VRKIRGIMRAEGSFRFLPQMNLTKWLYRGRRPNLVATVVNKCWAAVHALGVAPNYLVTLEVRGQRSGRTISLPLVMVITEGARYLEGLFSRTRNPNYLGEILIYTAFALTSFHWLPFLILAGWVFGFFVRNMLKKDRSLSRHPEFDEYKKRTGLLFPKLF
jgi:hypothetical protein